jgi:hypothetical protein
VQLSASTYNTQNLRGQALLFRCLETGFVTTAPALTRYQQGRGIDPSRRELIGNRPANWTREAPTTLCEHCGMAIKGNPVGDAPAPAVQAVPEVSENALMDNPLLMLLPWAVVALAAGVQFWRLTSAWRHRDTGTSTNPDQFRRSLEQNWKEDGQAA